MFAELALLGDIDVRSDLSQLPPLADLDPENCHVSWVLEILTDAPRGAIAQCFDWAGRRLRPAAGTDRRHRRNPPTPTASATSVAGSGSIRAASAAGTNVATLSTGKPADAAAATKANDSAKAAVANDSSSIRVSIEKIDELMNIVGELVITQSDAEPDRLQRRRCHG